MSYRWVDHTAEVELESRHLRATVRGVRGEPPPLVKAARSRC